MKGLREMVTFREGVKREVLNRLRWGRACVAMLASGGLVLH